MLTADGGWSNPLIRLYHATVERREASVLAGVDPSRGQDGVDFGRGFYTTTSLPQAHKWAIRRALVLRDRPLVVEFEVERDALSRLDSLWFVRWGTTATDYWRFVRHFRQGERGHRPDGTWYDIVVGPVTRQWELQSVWSDSDQVSFHTPRAADVLNTCGRIRVVP